MVNLVVFVGKDIILENMKLASKLRSLYDKYNVKVVEFLGGPGSGKTLLIERILERLTREYDPARILYIGGDVATSLDARRISRYNVRVVQVNTGGLCHLEVPHIEKALEAVGGEKALEDIDIILIENVGNMICPFNFPLGAHLRVMVASAAEGEDKFVKHPLSTKVSDIIIINKADLAEAAGVDLEKMISDAKRINPRAPVVVVSAKTGRGLDELYNILMGRLRGE